MSAVKRPQCTLELGQNTRNSTVALPPQGPKLQKDGGKEGGAMSLLSCTVLLIHMPLRVYAGSAHLLVMIPWDSLVALSHIHPQNGCKEDRGEGTSLSDKVCMCPLWVTLLDFTATFKMHDFSHLP